MGEFGNQAWKLEQNDINVVPDRDKVGRPMDLFWIWLGANIGILGVIYGAIIVSYRLSFLQAMLAAALGALSFAMVGYLSLAGRDGSAPMLILSRTIFGRWGNTLPTMISWMNLLGWETVTVITGALSLQAFLQSFLRIPTSSVSLAMSIVLFALVAIFSGLLGQATILVIQKVASWIFGLLTIVIILQLLVGVSWHDTWSMPTGNWFSGFLPAVSIIVAGTSISWGNAAADFSRYQRRSARSSSIVWAVTLGGALPLFILMLTGILLASRMPGLLVSSNPIVLLGDRLPNWMRSLYLFVAVGGLVTAADVSLYSSGLNLLTLGIRIKRYKSIIVDAIVMICLTVYILFIKQDFMSAFIAFVSLLGIGLAAWEAVFMVDQWFIRRRSKLRLTRLKVAAWFSWGVGMVVGLLFTASPLFRGPFANGIFSGNSLGVLVDFFVSGMLYAGFVILMGTKAEQ